MPSRLGGAAVALLAIGVLAGTVAMWVDFQARVAEVRAAALDATPAATPSSPASSPAPEGRLTSLWIGDGYTAGACDTADRLGWHCTVDAQQGTGFLSDGSSFDADFATVGDRLRDLPRAQPDVVVVDAGRNDLGVYATPALVAAMDDFLSRLRERYPDAALVQIVPWSDAEPRSDPAVADEVRDLMATYDGHAVAATGRPLTGELLAARLRALDLR